MLEIVIILTLLRLPISSPFAGQAMSRLLKRPLNCQDKLSAVQVQQEFIILLPFF